jgi:3-deoxy-D-manno-octulosonate 8-phosphate phosphatase (KDO 8-P phosphatase)
MSEPVIVAVFCDLDGTITDGRYCFHADGSVSKNFHTRDIHALCKLKSNNINVCVVTASYDQCNRKRFESLPVHVDLYENVEDKADFVKSICAINNISPDNCLFIGDGENDIEAMELCGYRACPSDASPLVLSMDNISVSDREGGSGAVEQIITEYFE